MSDSFKPPTGAALAEVDPVDEYHNQTIVIEGVVSPSGQGGWPRKAGEYEVHCFTFAGWRRPGDTLTERDLTLLRPVPCSSNESSTAENPFERFPAYSVQRFRVLMSKDETRAVVDEILALDEPGNDLISLSERLRKPVTLMTDRFGELLLNPSLGRFEGTVVFHGRSIELSLEPDERGDVRNAIRTAEGLFSDQVGWERKVVDLAVKKLLPLKNHSWLDDDEGELELTEEDFKARMEPESLSVENDGDFTFWYADGDLFLGHLIEVRGTLADGPTDAGIAG